MIYYLVHVVLKCDKSKNKWEKEGKEVRIVVVVYNIIYIMWVIAFLDWIILCHGVARNGIIRYLLIFILVLF